MTRREQQILAVVLSAVSANQMCCPEALQEGKEHALKSKVVQVATRAFGMAPLEVEAALAALEGMELVESDALRTWVTQTGMVVMRQRHESQGETLKLYREDMGRVARFCGGV